MLARIKYLLNKERENSCEKIKKIEKAVEKIDAFFPYIIDSKSLKPVYGKDKNMQIFSLSAFKVFKKFTKDIYIFVLGIFIYDVIKANDKNQVLNKLQSNVNKKTFAKRISMDTIENEFSTFYSGDYQTIQKTLKKIKTGILVDKDKEFLVICLEFFLQFPIVSKNEDYFPIGQTEFEGVLLACSKNTAKYLELIYKDTSIKPRKTHNYSRSYSNLSKAEQSNIYRYIDMLKDEKNFNISNDNLSQKEYWEKYYSSNRDEAEPNSFAKHMIKNLEKGKTLLELGCYNRRDDIRFSNKKINIYRRRYENFA